MTHVLLVEDDVSLGQTLFERVSKEGYQVSWSQCLTQATKVVETNQIDLILLDVGLPDGSGFEFAKTLRTKSDVPFIFITAQTSAADRLLGYEIGAAEYIPKPFHLKELLMRISHVLDNHRVSLKARYGAIEIDFDSMSILTDGKRRERLAAKDFQILRLLIESSPKVMSRDVILNKIWGDEKFPSNRTIDNIILRIRTALGAEAGQMIKSIRGIGYQWIPDTPEEER